MIGTWSEYRAGHAEQGTMGVQLGHSSTWEARQGYLGEQVLGQRPEVARAKALGQGSVCLRS